MKQVEDTQTQELPLDTPVVEETKEQLAARWHLALLATEAAKKVIAEESDLRKKVFALYFPAPTEGTNTVEFAGGWKLKGTYKLDRKVDEAALPAIFQALRDMYQVDAGLIVKPEPKLDTKAYKALRDINPEAAKLFETCLTIKPQSPTLELVAPKNAAAE